MRTHKQFTARRTARLYTRAVAMSDHGKDIQYLAEHLLHTGVDGLANRELQALMRISRKLQSVSTLAALPAHGPAQFKSMPRPTAPCRAMLC